MGLIGNVGIKAFIEADHDSDQLANAFVAIGEGPIAENIFSQGVDSVWGNW